MWALFDDRVDAGRRLAAELVTRGYADPVVLALPRGGVPVAAEIARVLGAPLDLLLVRKIGAPFQPELAVAAVIDGDEPQVVVNDETAALAGANEAYIERETARQLAEIERRRGLYLAGHPPVPVAGRTAIVVDDGVATGATMKAALAGLKKRGPAKLVVAVGVAPRETVAMLEPLVDEVVCLATPEPFGAIGLFYLDFRQIPDAEVVEILDRAERERASPSQ